MNRMATALALCLASVVTSAVAVAQTAPADPKSTQTIPEKDPTGETKKPPVSVTPGTKDTTSLSTKLDRSNGVIQPRTNVDPGMDTSHAPVPNPNSTPVIRPPSASGGATKAK